MLNKKFITRLLNPDFRKRILAELDKQVSSPTLKLKPYATYAVDKHVNERNMNYKDIKQAHYGFCPFDFFMWVSKSGAVKKVMVEFNIANHFLVLGEREKAVEVVTCMLAQLVKDCKKDIVSFDIDKIDAECKRMQEEYEKLKSGEDEHLKEKDSSS